MDRHMAAALDDYITGHGGEDQFADEETAMDDRPHVQLTGTDGNVFAIAAKVARALKQTGQSERAAEFYRRLSECSDYEAALRLVMEFVEVG